MNRAYLLALLTMVAACIWCNGGWIKVCKILAKQRNSGGTLRPELLRGIESRRLMDPTLDTYLNTVNQALLSWRLAPGTFETGAPREAIAVFTARSTTVDMLRDRHGAAAMTNNERRMNAEHRSGKDRRSGADTRSEEVRTLNGERRSTTDRRSGLDRRSNTAADTSPTNGRRSKD